MKLETIAVPVRGSNLPVLLSDAALAADVHLDLRCGGNGVCGRCAVEWQGQRLRACQTTVNQDGIMRIPQSSLVPEEWVVESAFAPPHPRQAHPRCRRLVVQVPAAREQPGVDDWERLCTAGVSPASISAAETAAVRSAGVSPASVRAGETPALQVSPEVLRKLPELIERGRPARLTILDDEVLDIEDEALNSRPVLGAAVDIGTTTVVVRLLDLVSGEELALAGAQNRQVTVGASVISRIAHGSTPHGLERLHKLVCKQTILPLLEKCLTHAKLHGTPVRRLVAGGNTTMMHLFLGLPPQGLGTVPFNAVTLAPCPASGAAVGLPVERVECVPAAGAYLGGDVLGGIYAVGLDAAGPPEMLIDVGTNSEILLRVGNRILGASAAAGPAFEGGGLTGGGPALPGAITHLRLNGNGFHLETCKGKAATHICGSAYVDFLAEGRKQGFLSEFGRIAPDFPFAEQATAPVPDAPSPHGGEGRVRGGRALRRCVIAHGVAVDEHDVSLLLQAKAAILAGVLILLRKAGIAPRDLHALHVAGGFGRHLNPEHAVRIGLLPPVPLERIKVVGNTSLAAASSALLNAQASREIRELTRRVQVVELNLEPDFEDCFINALSLP